MIDHLTVKQLKRLLNELDCSGVACEDCPTAPMCTKPPVCTIEEGTIQITTEDY